MKKFLQWILTPYYKILERRRINRRLAELRKRDPFIYK